MSVQTYRRDPGTLTIRPLPPGVAVDVDTENFDPIATVEPVSAEEHDRNLGLTEPGDAAAAAQEMVRELQIEIVRAWAFFLHRARTPEAFAARAALLVRMAIPGAFNSRAVKSKGWARILAELSGTSDRLIRKEIAALARDLQERKGAANG